MINERHKLIIELLKEHKKESVKNLAKKLFVSEATVRRDLTELKAIGLVKRSHGLAFLPENADEVSIFVRMNENAKEKELTATNALHSLFDFHSVFIDSSSTALALAQRIDLSFKTVVTNNLQTAILLSKKKNINLILLGGNVKYNTVSATGSWTVNQLSDFKFDLMLSSCAAVCENEAFENSIEQREIKRAAFMRSSKRILLVDHFKFNKFGTYRLFHLSDYDLVVTDTTPGEENLNQNINFVYDKLK